MPVLIRLLQPAALPLLAAASVAQVPVRQFVDELRPTERTMLEMADVDGDGRDDLIAVGALAANLKELGWHRNLGLGRFAPFAPLATGDFDPVIASRDLDADGDLDFLVLQSGFIGNAQVAVYRIEQQAGFTFAVTTIGQLPVTTNYASYVVPVDLDGDGDLDIVAGTTAPPAHANHALRNDGAGSFTNVTTQWFGAQFLYGHTAPVMTDVDGDNRPDLFYPGAPAHLLRNTGTTFVDETALRLPITTATGAAIGGDVDGDGDGDLLISDYFGPMQLLLNQGGTFTQASPGGLGASQGTPRLGDIDGDGDLDALVWDLMELRVLRNDGAGNFTNVPGQGVPFEPTSFPMPRRIDTLDLEGDGDLDVVLLGLDVIAMRNDGRGVFTERPTSARLPLGTSATVMADIDGDGDRDLIGAETWLRNEGNDLWTEIAFASSLGALRAEDQIGDIDGDGDLDIVTHRVFLNDGTGNFVIASGNGYAPATATDTALGDFDLDGDLDIVVAEGVLQSAIQNLYRNNGNGTFSPSIQLQFGVWTMRVDTTDADGDGRPDLLLHGTTPFGAPALLRNTTAGFVSTPLPVLYDTMRIANFGAGYDLVARSSSATRVFRLQGGAYVEITAQVIPAGFGPAAVGDYDGDGDLDLVGTDILQNDGLGNFTRVNVGLGAAPLALADVDGDRDLDALTSAGVLWNRERHLYLPLAPHIGRNLRVEVSSRPGRAQGDLAVLGMGLTSRSVGLPGPLGLLFLDQPLALQFVPIPNGSGIAELDLPVPNVPGIVGVALHLQTLHATPRGLGLGNLVVTTIE